MLADITNDTGDRVSIEETYSSAAGASNLKLEAHRRTPGDVILAAGLSKHATGLALMRLAFEWDRSSKPAPPNGARIEAIAATLEIEPPTEVEEDGKFLTKPNPHAGLVRELVDGKELFRLPLVVAQERAAAWHEHELKLLLQNLKSLPWVRDALTNWLAANECENAAHVVPAVLIWWLAPKCPVCNGVGQRIVQGTKRLSGQACGGCRRNKVPGERKVPHTGWGRSLLGYIKECLAVSRKELSAKFKSSRERRAQPPEQLVSVGERWRARDGRMWDIRFAINLHYPATLVASGAADPGLRASFQQNGRPWGEHFGGPKGNDLIERVGAAPAWEDVDPLIALVTRLESQRVNGRAPALFEITPAEYAMLAAHSQQHVYVGVVRGSDAKTFCGVPIKVATP